LCFLLVGALVIGSNYLHINYSYAIAPTDVVFFPGFLICDYLIFGYLRSLFSIGFDLSLSEFFKAFMSKNGALALFLLVVFIGVGGWLFYLAIERGLVHPDEGCNYFVHSYTMLAISLFCFLLSILAVVEFLHRIKLKI